MSLVGKKCPTISGGLVFIKGSTVQFPPPNKPMVVDFWASWCGPCRASMPHLSQLARKYKNDGLVVIAVNIEGDSPAVRNFVNSQGDKMDFHVAIDASQQASVHLMGAAGVSGIPCSFLIDAKGIIRHYGHPMEHKFAQMVDTVVKEAKSSAAGPVPVKKSREELLGMPVKELKAILTSWNVPFADLNEKSELVDRILDKCSSGA